MQRLQRQIPPVGSIGKQIYALHQEWDLAAAMELGAASSNFNLRSATATGGAVSLEKMQAFLKDCSYNPVPAELAGK